MLVEEQNGKHCVINSYQFATICIIPYLRLVRSLYRIHAKLVGGAEIVRPDNAAPDQTAAAQCKLSGGVWAEYYCTSSLNGYSTERLTVELSFCSLLVILSALIRSPYSRLTTAAAAAASTRTRPVGRPCQQRRRQRRRNP